MPSASKKKTKKPVVKGVLPIDKVKFGASLAKHRRLLDKLPKLSTPSLEQLEYALHKAPPTVEELFAGRAAERMTATQLMLLVVAADALGKGKPFVRRGSYLVGDQEVYAGDLHVKGSLTFSGNLLVLGDLVVDGLLREHWHGAHCLVAGSIRARGIKCGGTILSARDIQAEVVFVELGGKIGATTGLEAELVVIEDREIEVFAKVKAKNKIVLAHPNPKPRERLRALLAPSAFASLDDGIFDYSALASAIERGKPWSASKSAKPAKPPSKAKSRVRRFELVDGASKKFWEIRVDGASFTTLYGRIGADGQTTTKSFAGPSIASAEADKLVHEKRRKGYSEVALG